MPIKNVWTVNTCCIFDCFQKIIIVKISLKGSFIFSFVFLFLASSCQETIKKEPIKEQPQPQKMDLVEGEMPLPPDSVLKQKPVNVDSWFYTFADTPLVESAVTFRLGLFGLNDSLYVIAARLITKDDDEHDERKYKHYLITNEGFKKQHLPDVVREFQKKVQELGRSEKFKATSFGKNKTVTLIFDTDDSFVLGK